MLLIVSFDGAYDEEEHVATGWCISALREDGKPQPIMFGATYLQSSWTNSAIDAELQACFETIMALVEFVHELKL